MAQTWPVSRRRIAALKFVDLVGRAVTWPFRRRGGDHGQIERVLVVEPWNIGDVVLATPLLVKLRENLPKARITLLARGYARDLLKESGLVDEIIVADLPWTAPAHKYRITPRVAREMTNLVRELRRRRFDVTIDSRMDVRSNLLVAATGAPRRVGYSIGGGGWLLTDVLPSDRNDTHKIDDWIALLERLGLEENPAADRIVPRLAVDANERAEAARSLAGLAGTGNPTIAYHPGGSHPGKRWPLQRFRELMGELRNSIGGRHIVFLGPDEQHVADWPAGVVVMRPSLRDFMALISSCDVLVCNDSGPMHIADALGIPVVAIFEVGNPKWFGPSGPAATVIEGELAGIGMSAAPLDSPPRNPVSVERVVGAVNAVLGASRSLRR